MGKEQHVKKDWVAELKQEITNRKSLVAVITFCAVALAMILIGILALHTPVVGMCVLVILEAGIAVMLHKAELWVHGIMILAEVIAGILVDRIGLIILCVIVYAAATVALQVLGQDE